MAEHVAPDEWRCRWVAGGQRCPRRVRPVKRGRADYCAACSALATTASRRRRYERWKRSRGGALFVKARDKTRARMRDRRESGDPRYAEHQRKNVLRQRRHRALYSNGVMHFDDGEVRSWTACGVKVAASCLTADPAEVECRQCKRRRSYLAAVHGEESVERDLLERNRAYKRAWKAKKRKELAR